MINLNQYLIGASPYDSAYVLKYRDGEYSLETDPPLVPYTSRINSIQSKKEKHSRTLHLLLMVIQVSGI